MTDELAASLEGCCSICKEEQYWERDTLFEDQNTLLLYCDKCKEKAPEDADLLELNDREMDEVGCAPDTLMWVPSSTPNRRKVHEGKELPPFTGIGFSLFE